MDAGEVLLFATGLELEQENVRDRHREQERDRIGGHGRQHQD
jgi:hypothetical protein